MHVVSGNADISTWGELLNEPLLNNARLGCSMSSVRLFGLCTEATPFATRDTSSSLIMKQSNVREPITRVGN
jgi:hypothetical protein